MPPVNTAGGVQPPSRPVQTQTHASTQLDKLRGLADDCERSPGAATFRKFWSSVTDNPDKEEMDLQMRVRNAEKNYWSDQVRFIDGLTSKLFAPSYQDLEAAKKAYSDMPDVWKSKLKNEKKLNKWLKG